MAVDTRHHPDVRSRWTETFRSVRGRTEQLAAPLSAEDQTVQSMPDVSPTKWHRAHTSWFFETFVLERFVDGFRPFDPAYGYLFNSYYEGVGPRHPRAGRGLLSRPGVDDVTTYRRAVDEAMLSFIGQHLPAEAEFLVELGLHHEQQHQELLLMDIKHVLSVNPLQPAYQAVQGEPPQPGRTSPPLEWVEHSGGVVEIGHAGAEHGFAFDNEMPRHHQLVHPFAIASRPVTAREWVEFIDDGGYDRPELWLSDGWSLVQQERWRAPLYWSHLDGRWSVFTLAGRLPLDEAEPVCHVSYYEADAFARWSGARLPTEFEWEAAAMELLATGQVWEWTASPYVPYPGFRPAAGAVGEYNGKFMVNQQVLRGGSVATPAGHVRPTYRNFFHPDKRWAFSGLRLAKDA